MQVDYHKGYRNVYLFTAHLVFVCKCRWELLEGGRLQWVEHKLVETCHKWGVKVIEISGEGNHVHILIDYPPHIAISKLVANLKTVSSRGYKKEFGYKGSLWAGSYFGASCGGVTVDHLKQYVQNQNRPQCESLGGNSSRR